MIDKKTCPLCGKDNKCNSQGDICWCYNRELPEEILDLVPEELRGKSCICQTCVEKFNDSNKKFRKMIKKHMSMDFTRVRKLLKDSEYGIVSTVGEDGYPYGFPMSYVLYNNSIYFHCGLKGHKVDNLEYNNKVSFTVVGRTKLIPELQDTDYESIIAFGRASLVDGEEKAKVLEEIVNKYARGYEAEGYETIQPEWDIVSVYKIEIDHITGKERKDRKR